MKKLISIFTVLLLCGVLINAQQVTIEPYGVSPREADADTNDVFNRAYNALLNVGVQTQIYLMGTRLDTTLSGAQSWELVEKPDTSQITSLNNISSMGDNSEILVFTPDVIGQYKIKFSDGGVFYEVELNAGLFMGIEDAKCGLCHAGKKNEWENTGHASMLVRGLDGTLSSYYRGYCISCHTTGYDANAVNDGFDDFDFVFPDTLFVGQYDNMLLAYPDAMKRANIQCESCHGPGSEHFGNIASNRITETLDSQTCAICHDSGTYHYFPAQLKLSSHGNPKYAGYAGTRATCAPCHSGSGFFAYLENGMQPLDEAPPVMEWTCAVCHDPHSDENPHQLRTLNDVTLGNGFVVKDGGIGKFCMNCHKSRRNAELYTGVDFRYSRYYGPHNGPQADILAAENAITFGIKLPSSPHLVAGDGNSCVICHMGPGNNGDEGFPVVGGHTFNVMDPDGNDNVQVCAGCHGDVGASFAEKKYFMNGNADHDGDGVAEGLQEEVEGLLTELALRLPPYDTLAVDVSGKYEYTEVERKVAYNYLLVEKDRSKGIHNPAFVISLLKVSFAALEYGQLGPGVIAGVWDVPNDQGKKVNVAWTRFGGDGIAVNPINQYGVWRLDPIPPVPPKTLKSKEEANFITLNIGDQIMDENWMLTYVAYVPAASMFMYNVNVPTLYNTVETDTAWTGFVVSGITGNGNAIWSEPAFGFSVDNLVPAPPAGFSGEASETDITLTWLESEDEDFDYFAIYRSETQDFDPNGMEPIGTTSGTLFVDNSVEMGKTYYYKMSVVDFNKNESDYSAELAFTITSVEDESGIPTKYALYQNYPNPFNPATEIKFALPEAANVKITIYNSVGKEVAVIENRNFGAGYHKVTWNADNFASGVYFCELKTASFFKVNKMMLMK